MDKNLKFRALELLKIEGVELEDSHTFEESEFYDVIIKTNNKQDLIYYFYIENGELIFDGWCCGTCIPINEICEN